ncbi:MAG: hypothetical protein FJ011_18040 [Chloroflexi bacterium]|nr:hypothetical protein [Chloroflexota bacterium]
MSKLTLEALSGPLDGAALTLEAETEWSKAGQGSLSFPWDEELGAPQARFRPTQDGWSLEGVKSPHGTYRLNREERVAAPTSLAADDVLKASNTWLLVQKIE